MKIIYIIASVIFLLITGCSDNNTNPTPDGPGRIKVYLTDAPAAYDAVNITFSSVEVHKSGGEWFVINSDTQTVDLLELRNGAMILFCDTLLPPGHYTQIRLIVMDANVVVDGVTHPLDVPSGEQSGLKLIHQFTIEPDFVYELLLDFDANRSIIQTGNGEYKLKPTIRVVPMQISGIISGSILPIDVTSFVWTTQASDTMATITGTDGFFKLIALPEGVYSVYIEPLDTTYRDTVITGVNVINGQETDIGTVILTP